MKRSSLIKLDNILGSMLLPLVRLVASGSNPGAPAEIELAGVKNILIIRQGGIGDIVHTRPFVHKLRRIVPGLHLTVVCEKRAAELLAHLELADEYIVMDNLASLVDSISRIRRGRFDVAIDLGQKRRLPAILAALSGAPVRIGYDLGNRRSLFTHLVKYPHSEYEAACMYRILRYFGCDDAFVPAEIAITCPPGEIERARAAFGLPPEYRVVCHGGLKPENKLPVDTVHQLVERMLANDAGPVVFIGDRSDAPAVATITAGLPCERVIDLCGRTDSAQLIAVLAGAKLFFGYDAGPFHLAVALGIPTAVAWGPTIREKWHPAGDPRHQVACRDLPCRPCSLHRFPDSAPCPYGVSCISGISVDELWAKLQAAAAREPIAID